MVAIEPETADREELTCISPMASHQVSLKSKAITLITMIFVAAAAILVNEVEYHYLLK